MINDLEYWIKFSFDKMRKEGAIMPTIIPQIIEMEEFKNSEVTEDQLREGIKERFSQERGKIIENIKEKLKKLKQKE